MGVGARSDPGDAVAEPSLASTRLDRVGRPIGRAEPLAALEAALAAACRDGARYVLVGGAAGVGKTALLRAFGAEVTRREAVFAYGRVREGERAPYAGVGAALEALVGGMEATPSPERDRWRAECVNGLSGLADVLCAIVPPLADVLGSAADPDPVETPDRRPLIRRAAARLIGITAAFRPVVLAIDDVHRADQDSMLLLADLLASSLRNVLLLAALRCDSLEDAAPALPAEGRSTIALEPLAPYAVSTLLVETCGPTAHVDAVAAEVHYRTSGNPLQIHQLLRLAHREGVLTWAEGGPPVWDLPALAAMPVAGAQADVLGRALDELAPEDAALVGAMACLDGDFGLADLVAATAVPPEAVGRAVWSALELRLIDAVDATGHRLAPVLDHAARYRFVHDRVAEEAVARLPVDVARAVHRRVGIGLADHGEERLFEAAHHLALSGATADEADPFARVQLRAARLARLQASYPVALDCYRAGLELLGELRWTEHAALTRELQLGAAEAAMLLADGTLLDRLTDEAWPALTDHVDRAHLSYLRMRVLVAELRFAECLTTGHAALELLGEPLAHSPGRGQAAMALLQMRRMTRDRSDAALLGMPRCADPRVAEAQLILSTVGVAAYSVRPTLIPLILRKQLALTFAHGLVPSSPAVLANYALLRVLTGDLAGAQRFGEVAVRLSEHAWFRGARARALFVHLNFVRHLRHPIRDGLPLLREAYQEAVERGDPENAGLLATTLLYQAMFAGRPLAEVDALAQTVLPEIRSQRGPDTFCRSIQQLCLNGMGRCADPLLLAGESGYDERVVVEAARRENDTVSLGVATIMKLGLHFWYGDDRGAIPVAAETERYLAGLSGTPNVQLFHMVNALSRIQVAPDDRATARAVRKALALHGRWAAAAPANYAAPAALIRGAWLRARGALGEAERHLDRAIALADQHRLPLVGALAHEQTAALYARTGRTSLQRIMLRSAYERWVGLDVVIRGERLAQEHPWLRGRELVTPGSATVDAAEVYRLGQALAAAPTVEDLADVLLGAVADTTGATRVLLLVGEDGPAVRAVRTAAGVTMADDVAHDRNLVRRAVQTGHAVAATRTQDGASGARTVVPVRLRGRIIGAVHLELPASAAGFGPGHEEAVEALCATAAAPLWSLELEGRLRRADERRRSLLEAQSRFIPTELLRILDVDDIGLVRRGQRVERAMTVLISDIRGYTSLLEGLDVDEASEVALGFLRAVEVPIITNNGLLQDVRGDEVLAVFDARPDDALRAGLAMLRSLRDHNRERVKAGAKELSVGIGVNSGVVALGLVGGVNRMALTVIGDAVNLAARVESTTKRYGAKLLISEETRAQLVDPAAFALRRMERVNVVNRRQPVTLFEVYDEDPPTLRAAKRAAQPVFDEAFDHFDAGAVVQARAAFARGADLLPGDPIGPLHLAHCDALERGDLMPGHAVALRQK